MAAATCDVRFSLQDEYADDDRLLTALGELKITNHAVTVSGRAIRSEKEISIWEFIHADAETIRSRLEKYLEKHPLPRSEDDLVILDMEPKGFSPRDLGKYRGSEQRELIDAYRRRIQIARQVLRKRGNAGIKFGLY